MVNTSKTKEVIADSRRRTDLQPICGEGGQLGVHMELRWSSNTSAVVKKVQHFVRILRRISLNSSMYIIYMYGVQSFRT